MRHQQTTGETAPKQESTAVSFEVNEVVSLLAAFERRIATPETGLDEDYDPFAPGFTGMH